ncbi:MAG: hypothetical protein ACHQ51_08965 [Elusimicrobiota bacterium]
MGLDVYLEDEFGEELDSSLDEGGVLAAAWPTGNSAYPMLRYVDSEGATTFNRLQLEAVLPELESFEKASAPAVKPFAARAVRLARKAAAEPHLYLRFLGD